MLFDHNRGLGSAGAPSSSLLGAARERACCPRAPHAGRSDSFLVRYEVNAVRLSRDTAVDARDAAANQRLEQIPEPARHRECGEAAARATALDPRWGV